MDKILFRKTGLMVYLPMALIKRRLESSYFKFSFLTDRIFNNLDTVMSARRIIEIESALESVWSCS